MKRGGFIIVFVLVSLVIIGGVNATGSDEEEGNLFTNFVKFFDFSRLFNIIPIVGKGYGECVLDFDCGDILEIPISDGICNRNEVWQSFKKLGCVEGECEYRFYSRIVEECSEDEQCYAGKCEKVINWPVLNPDCDDEFFGDMDEEFEEKIRVLEEGILNYKEPTSENLIKQQELELKLAELYHLRASLEINKFGCLDNKDYFHSPQKALEYEEKAYRLAGIPKRDEYCKNLAELKIDYLDKMMFVMDNGIEVSEKFMKDYFPEDWEEYKENTQTPDWSWKSLDVKKRFQWTLGGIDYWMRKGHYAREAYGRFGAPTKEQLADLIYSRLRLMEYYKGGFTTLQMMIEDLNEEGMGCEADSFYCEFSDDLEKLMMIRDAVGSDVSDEELVKCLEEEGCEDLIRKKYATDIICEFSDIRILINNGDDYGLIDDDYSFRGTRRDLDRCNVIPVDRFKFVSVPEINGEPAEYALFENYPYLPITPVEAEEYGDLLDNFNALLITKAALLAVGGVSFGSAYANVQTFSEVVKTTAIFGGWIGTTSVIDYSLHQLHPASADLASDIINTALFAGAGIVARHVVIKSGGRYRLAEYFSSEEIRAKYVKIVGAKKVPGTEDVYRVKGREIPLRVGEVPKEGVEIKSSVMDRLSKRMGERRLRCREVRTTCFAKDTLISMSDGSKKKIQEIKINDEVLSFDIENKKMTKEKVRDIYSRNINRYYKINNKIKVTSEHPFYINGKWKKVKDLKIGDKMFDGSKEVRIENIELVDVKIKVYNLYVDGFENYFAEGMLVHNKPDFELDPRYKPFAEELNNIRKEDPALYDLINYWRKGDVEVKPVSAWARNIEKRMFDAETRAIKQAISNKETSIKLPNAEHEIGWRFDDMYRWASEHGPSSSGKTRFDNPKQIFAEAIHKTSWEGNVQDAIRSALKKPRPRVIETIAEITTQARDMDLGRLQNLGWEIQRGIDGKIYKIASCRYPTTKMINIMHDYKGS